jgi:hypothetical protein
MTLSILKQPAALAPLLMSATALALVVGHIVFVGTAREPDEGTAAHLWQILMAAQLPVIGIFAVTSLPRAPRAAAVVLALQIAAAVAAAAPVSLLGW